MIDIGEGNAIDHDERVRAKPHAAVIIQSRRWQRVTIGEINRQLVVDGVTGCHRQTGDIGDHMRRSNLIRQVASFQEFNPIAITPNGDARSRPQGRINDNRFRSVDQRDVRSCGVTDSSGVRHRHRRCKCRICREGLEVQNRGIKNAKFRLRVTDLHDFEIEVAVTVSIVSGSNGKRQHVRASRRKVDVGRSDRSHNRSRHTVLGHCEVVREIRNIFVDKVRHVVDVDRQHVGI